MADGPFRILVADDDALLRDAIVDLLVEDGRFEVVAAVDDADSAIDAALRSRPDLALVDVRIAGGGGPRIATELREKCPSTRVVALSSMDDRASITLMFRSGAISYLVKGDASNQEIVSTLAEAARGHVRLGPAVGRHLLDELSERLQIAHRQEEWFRAVQGRIRQVLASGMLDIVLQPIFGLPGGDRIGAEALARFPVEPLQGPDRWFADAASVGLGVELEVLAVRRALVHLEHLEAGTDLSINVSPTTACAPEFQALVLGVDPRRVVMEVTEHAPIEDYDLFLRSIEPLRTAGVRLAVDDTGAGYASLRHIVLLAPDVIKLDTSLTRGIDTHRTRRALARALISFAAESGATVVAEGVETVEEFDTLRRLGVTSAQGYLLGRPVVRRDLPARMPQPPTSGFIQEVG